jgi:8-oxo-dGTP diphosphatase
MNNLAKSIRKIDLTKTDITTFKRCYVGCIVLTQDHRVLLQKLIYNRKYFKAGSITTFGGRIEIGETSMLALVRELEEELGAQVKENDVIFLGAITEETTNHTELINTYFWHDKDGTITGCYEDEAIYFDEIGLIISNSKVTDDVRWMLDECQKRKLIQ